MELYIGGYAQGKLDYVLQSHQGWPLEVAKDPAAVKAGPENEGKIFVFCDFHLWVRRLLEKGGEPEKELELFLEKNPDCIIISDEVGNGIVPLRQMDREYRERLGRILVSLAQRAERVERVICGIGQRIK